MEAKQDEGQRVGTLAAATALLFPGPRPPSTPHIGNGPAVAAPLVAQPVKNSPAMRETWVEQIPWRR